MVGVSAARLRMEAREGGKLHLPDHPELGFNLSHSGDWIVLATAPGCEVGVDIENVDPTFPALEIADEFFLPSERKWIGAGKDPTLRFFQLWTAKEALMKATGEGMFLPPDQILITPAEARAGEGAAGATATDLRSGSIHNVLRGPDLGVAVPAGMVLAVVCQPSASGFAI